MSSLAITYPLMGSIANSKAKLVERLLDPFSIPSKHTFHGASNGDAVSLSQDFESTLNRKSSALKLCWVISHSNIFGLKASIISSMYLPNRVSENIPAMAACIAMNFGLGSATALDAGGD